MQRLVLLMCLCTILLAAAQAKSYKISPELQAALTQSKSATFEVIVKLKGGNGPALQRAKLSANMGTLEARAASVSRELQLHARESQSALQEFLNLHPELHYESFWINNVVFIQNASPDLIADVSARQDVESVQLNSRVELLRPATAAEPISGRVPENGWNVVRVQAPDVWALGYNGTGVRVAIIDHGTRSTHVDLVDKFIGLNGWYDPVTKSEVPEDVNGHGTHVMGTILGGSGIGIAPGAKWLSCNFFNTPTAETVAIHTIACGQWLICPTLTDGVSSPDCSKTPHLVSNSWGLFQGWEAESFYAEVVEAWHVVGIIPIFAYGNDGMTQDCASGRFPGSMPTVIAVGATDHENAVAPWSSRGPASYAEVLYVKPDISAPGHIILSASNESDITYSLNSGTSMASPHVAGVVALLFSIKPDLAYEELKEVLFAHTTTDVLHTERSCDGTGDEDWPNNFYGHGLINALNSALALTGGSRKYTDKSGE